MPLMGVEVLGVMVMVMVIMVVISLIRMVSVVIRTVVFRYPNLVTLLTSPILPM